MSHEKRLAETVKELAAARQRMRDVIAAWPWAPPGDACAAMWTAAYEVALEARPEGSKPPVLSMPAATALPSPIVEDDYQPEGA